MKGKLSCVMFLAATTILAQNSNTGQSTEQLQDLASHAKDSGDLQSAADYTCQAAALDGKKYGKKCDRAKADADKALAQFQADLAMGRTELQRKDYPGALRDLGKITFGPNKTEAQEWIQQARIGISGSVAVDPASFAAFKAAREAYFRGDFDTAESQAKRVQSPALQAAANQLLANMSVYRDVMNQADAMTNNGDLKGAEQKYEFAVTILQNGPGHPQDRLREVQAAEAQAATAKPQPQAQPQPVATDKATQGKGTQPPPEMNHAAKIKNWLDTARREETQGDLKNALQNYNAALESDGRQAEAVAGKKRVLEQMQEDSKRMEESLTEGVADFYTSHFSHADDAIRVYLQGGGKHYAGSAHFYLGASLLMEALLTSPKDQPEADALRQQARDQFVLARQLHYKPIESTVPPKVLAQWTHTGEQ
jgi:tetratricopeptide (TPR) repeat protein